MFSKDAVNRAKRAGIGPKLLVFCRRGGAGVRWLLMLVLSLTLIFVRELELWR